MSSPSPALCMSSRKHHLVQAHAENLKIDPRVVAADPATDLARAGVAVTTHTVPTTRPMVVPPIPPSETTCTPGGSSACRLRPGEAETREQPRLAAA